MPRQTTLAGIIARRACVRQAIACLGLAMVAGCGDENTDKIVFFCDGAGWYSGAGPVKAGLRAAGFEGVFKNFAWSGFLGPAHDHIIVARSKLVAARLSREVETARKQYPKSVIAMMGLSAGTSVVLSAVEQLDRNVQVDSVVLLSSSVSATRDLTNAMRRVRGCLYATTSPHDGILPSRGITADGRIGRFAGEIGFKLPNKGGRSVRDAYGRVVNLPWKPQYLAFGWDGGHTSVTQSRFIETVIAPRIFSDGPHPLDRSVLDLALARAGGV